MTTRLRAAATRAALVTATSAVLLAGGTGIAAAAPNPNVHPDITQSGYCGPGYYPWSDYGRCVPRKTLIPPSRHKTAQHNLFGWGAIAVGALLTLV